MRLLLLKQVLETLSFRFGCINTRIIIKIVVKVYSMATPERFNNKAYCKSYGNVHWMCKIRLRWKTVTELLPNAGCVRKVKACAITYHNY